MTISKFKATCLEALRRVQVTGQPLLITRHGEPVAQIVPPSLPHARRTWLGFMKGTVTIHGDIISPVAEEDWEVLHFPADRGEE